MGNSWASSNHFANYDGCYFGKFEILNENEIINELWYADWVGVSTLIKSDDGGDKWNQLGNGFEFIFSLADFEFLSNLNGWVTTQSRSIFQNFRWRIYLGHATNRADSP